MEKNNKKNNTLNENPLESGIERVVEFGLERGIDRLPEKTQKRLHRFSPTHIVKQITHLDRRMPPHKAAARAVAHAFDPKHHARRRARPMHPKRGVNEAFLKEIHPSTLARYIKKASSKMSSDLDILKSIPQQAETPAVRAASNYWKSLVQKKTQGITLARDKLSHRAKAKKSVNESFVNELSLPHLQAYRKGAVLDRALRKMDINRLTGFKRRKGTHALTKVSIGDAIKRQQSKVAKRDKGIVKSDKKIFDARTKTHITELSTKLLRRYVSKASKEWLSSRKAALAIGIASDKAVPTNGYLHHKINKHSAGLYRAETELQNKKMMHTVLMGDHEGELKKVLGANAQRKAAYHSKKLINRAKAKGVNEAFLKEINKKTLISYMMKAPTNAADLSARIGRTQTTSVYDRLTRKVANRLKGMSRARKRVFKEGAINEISPMVLRSYIAKAAGETESIQQGITTMQKIGVAPAGVKALWKHVKKRTKGIELAKSKIVTHQVRHQDKKAIVIDTPEGIAFYRLLVLRSAIKLFLKTGIIPTRGVNAARMKEMVSQYTKKTYARSKKGTEEALKDLENFMNDKLRAEGKPPLQEGAVLLELSPRVYRAYRHSAREWMRSATRTAMDIAKASKEKTRNPHPTVDRDKLGQRLIKRINGVPRAERLEKRWYDRRYGKVDELSVPTLTSYVKKATRQFNKVAGSSSWMHPHGMGLTADVARKTENRYKGIKLAKKKLNEISLTLVMKYKKEALRDLERAQGILKTQRKALGEPRNYFDSLSRRSIEHSVHNNISRASRRTRGIALANHRLTSITPLNSKKIFPRLANSKSKIAIIKRRKPKLNEISNFLVTKYLPKAIKSQARLERSLDHTVKTPFNRGHVSKMNNKLARRKGWITKTWNRILSQNGKRPGRNVRPKQKITEGSLNELSKELLSRYITKANASGNIFMSQAKFLRKKQMASHRAGDLHGTMMFKHAADLHREKLANRALGTRVAQKKIEGSKPGDWKSAYSDQARSDRRFTVDKHLNKEEKSLNEISKRTLALYIHASGKDIERIRTHPIVTKIIDSFSDAVTGKLPNAKRMTDKEMLQLQKLMRKMIRRKRGINKAQNKYNSVLHSGKKLDEMTGKRVLSRYIQAARNSEEDIVAGLDTRPVTGRIMRKLLNRIRGIAMAQNRYDGAPVGKSSLEYMKSKRRLSAKKKPSSTPKAKKKPPTKKKRTK